MRTHLLLLASLASLPLVGTAQTISSSHRFYLALGASALTDRGFRSADFDNDPIKVGPSLTFGAWLTPRLALQISEAVAWNRTNASFIFYDYSTPTPTPVFANTVNTRTIFYTLPVLLRYTFTPITAKLHLDALGGITILHSTLRYDETSTRIGYPYSGSYDSNLTKLNVTFGPALRYTLTRNLQVSADPLVNITLDNRNYSFRDRLFWNLQAGLHYSFG